MNGFFFNILFNKLITISHMECDVVECVLEHTDNETDASYHSKDLIAQTVGENSELSGINRIFSQSA